MVNDRSDQQLLRDYAARRVEAAFAELVRRHVDFVYSAALRMVCDAHLAEDVTQGVFAALAGGADQLADRAVLSGWLHRTTRNLAAQTVRTEVRRRAREQEAAAMNELSTSDSARWEQIAPQLDAVLGELSEPDRDALLLRYFERKSGREMAQALGISDEAAQKRVNRAVDRLRELFAKRGLAAGAGGLAAVISANAVQTAPAGLAAAVATAASITGTSAVTATAIKTIAMTTLQKIVIGTAVAISVGTGVYEAHQAARWRDQVQTLRQQQAPLNDQIQQLQQERDAASRQLAALRAENEHLNRNASELLQLRNRLTTARRNQATPVAATPGPAAAPAPAPVATADQSPLIEMGRQLGQAVVRGDPGAMQKVRDLAATEHQSLNTNSIGLDDGQRGELAAQTFAPLRAAFKVIGDAAAQGSQPAVQAISQAVAIPELQGTAVQTLGTLAGGGNNDALDILLNYQQYGLLLSGAVSALQPAADSGNQKAIAFLAAVAADASQQGLWYMAAAGLAKAANTGNVTAINALVTMYGSGNGGIKDAALADLRQAAVQNSAAAAALQSLGGPR